MGNTNMRDLVNVKLSIAVIYGVQIAGVFVSILTVTHRLSMLRNTGIRRM
jgi:uncharacterized alkaline shock family protein YloU